MVDPKPGDWFVVRTNGFLAKIVRFGTSSSVNHAGIYVGNNQVLEARPGGLGYKALEVYKDALWSTDNLPAKFVPTDEQRLKMVSYAISRIGTKYGMLDIVCIGLSQKIFHNFIKPDKPIKDQHWFLRPILKRLSSKVNLICSQYVDLDNSEVGIHFFDDGRLPGLISPEDLRQILINGIIEKNS